MSSTIHYIRDQLMAGYAYFGVPRLARNGRPLFTKVDVQVLEPSNAGQADTSAPDASATGEVSSREVVLLNSLDPNEGFESQLDTVSKVLSQ